MIYENQVSDELLDQWVIEVLLKHPEGMTGRELYDSIRYHQIPDGTILDSHVVNSYLYSNCWGREAKYRYVREFKPVWFLKHPQRFPVVMQTDESMESMVGNMVVKIAATILTSPSADERKMASDVAMKLVKDKGGAITDMLYGYFSNNDENFVGDKELFCAQKLSFKALKFLDYVDSSVDA